jgi:putative spermidine/putrescine transport system permease protein
MGAGVPHAPGLSGTRMRRHHRSLDSYALLILPLVGFLAITFYLPVGEMLLRSVSERPEGAAWSINFSWFFEREVNVRVLVRTFLTAFWVTVWCLLIGYPYAYMMTRARGIVRIILIGAVLLPFWTSFVVRNFAWIVLLQDNGPVATALKTLGFGSVEILGTTAAVTIGMAQVMLPMMVLPAYATMRRIDPSLMPAARGLGAHPLGAFTLVYLPLSLPGVFAGALLVFVISLGFYITPAMLGSPSNSMLSQLIVTEVNNLLAWGHAGAMASVLLSATLLFLGLAAMLAQGSIMRLGAGR